MADLSSFIDFTALFRLSATGSTMELINTGTYGVSTTDRWEVRMPSGATRTVTGSSVSIELPKATDGSWQQGVYLIQPFVDDGTDDSTIPARPFPLTIKNQQPKPAQRIDYTIPQIVYVDQQDYLQQGFSAPTVQRSWSATRSGSSIALTSNAATFDLQEYGYYYRSRYTIDLAVTVTYVSVANPWATVVATFVVNDTLEAKLYPTTEEMMGWISAGKKTKSCGCYGSCGCSNTGTEAFGVYALVKDFFCAGQPDQSYSYILKLYKLTHNGMSYRPVFDNSILEAVDLCGCGGSQVIKKLAQLTVATSGVLHTSFNFGATAVANANRYKWELYSDNSLTTLVDSGTGNTSAFSFGTATAGATYYGRMRAEDSTGVYLPGDWALFTVTTYANLQITVQPQAATASNGAAGFSVTVTGGVPPLVHQWFKNTPPSTTAAVPNSNNRILNVTGLTSADNGATFYDIVTDADGHTVQSGNGTLTVQSVVPTLSVLRSATSLLAIFSNPAGIDSVVLQHDGTNFGNPTEVVIPVGTTQYEIPNLTPGTLKNLRVKSRKAGRADSGWSTVVTKTTFNRRLLKTGSVASDGVTIAVNNTLQEFHFDAIGYQLTTQSAMKPLENGTQVARVDFFDDYLTTECAIRKVSGAMFYGNGTTQATIINGNITT